MADPNIPHPSPPPEQDEENPDRNNPTSASEDSDDDFQFEDADEEFPINDGGIQRRLPFPLSIGPHRALSNEIVDFAGLFFRNRGDPTKFVQNYQVLSVRLLENRGHQNLENGGKVILPASALQQLSRNSSALITPMMFKATNTTNQKFTHCGVLEFIAEEGLCYMPSWMMDMLGIRDHDTIQIERVTLPIARFTKFQPQSVDFLEISNPKAMLENVLRQFACLTKGDIISIHYNSRVYKLLVVELLPQNAVNIIECDMDVDFAEPVGYQSPSAIEEDETYTDAEETPVVSKFVPFVGSGKRLNGKDHVNTDTETVAPVRMRGMPDTTWQIGTLRFNRKPIHKKSAESKEPDKFTAFGGVGLSLKSTKKTDGSADA